jgi:hypothetical protein
LCKRIWPPGINLSRGVEAEIKEFRSSGVQEFRSSGVQEFRSSGVQEFRSSGVQERSSADFPFVNGYVFIPPAQ